MLNQKDIYEIRKIVREEIRIDTTHPTKDEFNSKIADLENKINFLPTKDEFYNTMDKLMVEIKAVREEQVVITENFSEIFENFDDHETIIRKLEKSTISAT